MVQWCHGEFTIAPRHHGTMYQLKFYSPLIFPTDLYLHNITGQQFLHQFRPFDKTISAGIDVVFITDVENFLRAS